MNQSNANVSVVRLGQAETDTENGDITLTVDPPTFTSTTVSSGSTAADAGSLVDPFMEMDPEQLERLETALQSEEAKQILGENVTAMLGTNILLFHLENYVGDLVPFTLHSLQLYPADMLTVEEQQNSIRHSIELDHCYTSRTSPSDPKPRDPLPSTDSPASGDSLLYPRQLSPAPQGSAIASSPIGGDSEATVATKLKGIGKAVSPVCK